MRIGIDIDGVLTDIERFVIDYGSKYTIEHNLPLQIKLGEYEEKKAFGWTQEQTLEFWQEYLVYYATKYPTREFASEIIQKLKAEGHEIYLVTARNNYGLPKEYDGKMKELVEKWLKDNAISYDKIIYTEESKLPYCVGNYIEIMIEDDPEHIEKIATKIPVLCFDSQYNKKIEGCNITRVYSWYDVYHTIKMRK